MLTNFDENVVYRRRGAHDVGTILELVDLMQEKDGENQDHSTNCKLISVIMCIHLFVPCEWEHFISPSVVSPSWENYRACFHNARGQSAHSDTPG